MTRLSLNRTRREQLALALLLAVTAAFDLWAVLADHRPSGSDTYTQLALGLAAGLDQYGPGRWLHSLVTLAPKGPLAPLLALPLILLSGQALAGARLLSLLCHGVLTLQAYLLGRRLHPGAGLWAALICAAHPFIAGWCRLDYQEPLLTCLLLGGLLLLLRDPGRPPAPGRALALGALAGLGVLTKLSFLVYLLAPAAWALLRWGGSPAGRRALALGVVGLVLVAGPWVLLNLGHVQENYRISSDPGRAMPLALRLQNIWLRTHLVPLLVAALAGLGALLAGRRPPGARLLLVALLLPLAAFLFWFHYWSRYLLPVLVLAAPAAALLPALLLDPKQARSPAAASDTRGLSGVAPPLRGAGPRLAGPRVLRTLAGGAARRRRALLRLGLTRLATATALVSGLDWAAGARRRGWTWLLWPAAGLAGLWLAAALTPRLAYPPRETTAGMVRPDPGPYDGLARSMGALRAAGARWWVVLPDSELALSRLEGMDQLLAHQGLRSGAVEWRDARVRRARGEPLHVVLVMARLGPGQRPNRAFMDRAWKDSPDAAEREQLPRAFRHAFNHPGRRPLFQAKNADGTRFQVLVIGL